MFSWFPKICRFGDGCSVFAGIGGAGFNFGFAVEGDGLAATHTVRVCRTDVDEVAEVFELVDGRGGEAVFNEDGTAFGDGPREAG